VSNAEANRHLIEDHYRAMWSGDEDALRRQLAHDFIDHGTPGGMRGVEPVISHSRTARQIFPDMVVKFRAIIAEGDRVAVHAVWRGTHSAPFMDIPATNRTIEFEGMVFWRVHNGKVAERWAFLDTAGLVRQLRA
jgi:steroid delta-isomerase-like uncharacterized protein